MTVFLYENYRKYIKNWISSQPRNGRGELSRLATVMGMHPTLLSMILNGNRDLSIEQAFDLSLHFSFTELERDYFLCLVQLERAGNKRLANMLEAKLKKLKMESQKTVNRFEHEKRLSEKEQEIFYSSWMYSGIRLFTSTVDKGVSLQEICMKFNLDRIQAKEKIDFLTSCGLVIKEKELYKMGVSRTFLERNSVQVSRHHLNWRLKALQNLEAMTPEEMMFTSPISVSAEDFSKIREEIRDFLQKFSKDVKDSPAEDVACLNIDFFWVMPQKPGP